MNTLIIITIISLFFPVHFQVMGQDAITSGSIMCAFLFSVFVLRKLLTKKPGSKFALIGISLIMIALISTLSVPPQFLGPSFRRFVQFVCAILLFFTLINYYSEFDYIEQKRKIEFLLSLVIGLIAVQIIIGIILYIYPPFGKLLSIFTTRTVDVLVTSVTDINIKRLNSLIAGGETFGELIAVMSPLVLYKLVRGKKVYNYSVFFLYVAACFLTVTRSSILLMITGLFLYAVINRRQINVSLWLILSYLFVLVTAVIVFYMPDILDPVITRFQMIFTKYEKESSILDAINRRGVWEATFVYILSNISLFGHGMISLFGNQSVNIHNLYLTLLHQIGVVGLIVMLIFLFQIGFSMIKTFRKSLKKPDDQDQEFSLISACLISFFIFLINEFKFEFIRHASYQQIFFVLFTIYLLVSQSINASISKCSSNSNHCSS